MTPIVKTCTCGHTWTRDQWRHDWLCQGSKEQDPGDGPSTDGWMHYTLELVTCRCGTTLALEVKR